MFGDTKEKNYHYYGSDTHKYINKMIKSSKTMYIISPYLDKYYAQFLVRRSPATEFYIISSSMEDEALRILQKRGSKLAVAFFGALSILLFYLEIVFGIGGYLLLLALIPFLFGLGRYFSRMVRVKGIRVKIPKQFVHAKMYISDDQAISGSMNLTYKGTHSNVEHIEISKDREEIEKLREQFWDLWNAY